jgi:predicted ATP-grasp superfamily ATP-dependent carboligase
LLGVTRQLVGVDWLHAAPFHYCGSVGPIALESALQQQLERLGTAVAAGCELRGLFGVDYVLRDGVPFPVEVNPRYTASVEILELATGLPVLHLHRGVFDLDEPSTPRAIPSRATLIIGKGIMFATKQLSIPTDGPWLTTLCRPPRPWDVPAFADLPSAGQVIKAGRPILTLFSKSESLDTCFVELRSRAEEIDRWLRNN